MQKHRLVTRSDIDGLVCAVLLRELDLIDEITFVHPKDMQDGLVEVGSGDITTNLPYVEGVYLAFDHHYSETLRFREKRPGHIINPAAPSAARVVFDHYGGPERFPGVSREMLAAVDKADAATYTMGDVLNPQGWVLLSFVMDARTGLGRFHHFRISNYRLMMDLIEHCRTDTIDEILQLPDVRERLDLYFAHEERFKEQLRECSRVFGNLVVLDLRREDVIWPGNRFMVYALHPECNISVHVLWGKKRRNTVFAVGKSIFDRSSRSNVGELMLAYGGGGHVNAGTCQVDNAKAEIVLDELIDYITSDG